MVDTKKHKVYVYGTLRTGESEPVKIKGFKMFNMGWFPAVVRDESGEILVECREADDSQLAAWDIYEGFDRFNPEQSFYRREQFEDGWIYVFNDSVSGYNCVESGDWFTEKEEKMCA